MGGACHAGTIDELADALDHRKYHFRRSLIEPAEAWESAESCRTRGDLRRRPSPEPAWRLRSTTLSGVRFPGSPELPLLALRCVRDLLPGRAAANARRLFRDDVRGRTGRIVACLDEDPAPFARPREAESAAQLVPREREREVTRRLLVEVERALVPDDDRPGAARGALVNALELACAQGMVIHRDRESPLRGIERRSLRHRPGAQRAADLEAQVEVQRRRIVQLDDEPGHAVIVGRAHRPAPQWRRAGRCYFANRRTNVSPVSATSRQPLSIVRACPRFGISTISVTPSLRFCFLNDAFAIAHGTV